MWSFVGCSYVFFYLDGVNHMHSGFGAAQEKRISVKCIMILTYYSISTQHNQCSRHVYMLNLHHWKHV
jgi:hypothetical protein